MRTTKTILACIGTSMYISGCAFFTPPLQRPVIEDKLNPAWLSPGTVGTLSLTPERRVVLVNFATERFCAEAPTEVGIDLSKILSASGSADATSQGNIALGLLIGSSSGNTVLNKRSQAVQLFLANSYYGCQMYLNGAISGEQLVTLQLETLNSIAPVLEKELPLLYNEKETSDESTYVPLDINRIIKELFDSSIKTSKEEDQTKPKGPTPPVE
ncbi:hypothetical protein [Vreelandella utahensis]|uniref:hypothetical protein n=1 Tax=Vreelandella halophila TaxID=86177 RepID=UPI00117ACE8A|nr:hypothetical protein [Halomonas utahensis]